MDHLPVSIWWTGGDLNPRPCVSPTRLSACEADTVAFTLLPLNYRPGLSRHTALIVIPRRPNRSDRPSAALRASKSGYLSTKVVLTVFRSWLLNSETFIVSFSSTCAAQLEKRVRCFAPDTPFHFLLKPPLWGRRVLLYLLH